MRAKVFVLVEGMNSDNPNEPYRIIEIFKSEKKAFTVLGPATRQPKRWIQEWEVE